MSIREKDAIKKEPESPSDHPASSNGKSRKIKRVYYDTFHENVTIILYNSNIIEIDDSVDALVNCTGDTFQTSGGISKAIVYGAGKKINRDFDNYLKTKGPLRPLEVVDTPAYDLRQHRYILHVISPSFHRRFTHHNNILTSQIELVYASLLQKACNELKLNSLAVPLIGTGLAGIPLDESLNHLIESIRNFNSFPSSGITIYLVNNDSAVVKYMERFIDEKLLYSNVKAEKIKPKDQHIEEAKVKEEKVEPGTVKKEEPGTVKREEPGAVKKEEPGAVKKEEPGAVKKEEPGAVKKEKPTEEENECAICLCKIVNGKKLTKCKHEFCRECIDQHFKYKKTCPTCGWVYDIMDGTQPDGKMTHKRIDRTLPGFDNSVKTIEIVYSIPDGIQKSNHPNPGRPYRGTVRTAYLPDNEEGNKVLKLLKKAFDHRLVFTIGQSRTTGSDNVVTWNDIHHKTSTHGGTSNFGYPDATYLSRVTQELAAKGIF